MIATISRCVDSVADFLWIGSAIALFMVPLASVLARVGKLRRPVYRHMIWMHCLVGIVVLPSLWLCTPKLTLSVLPSSPPVQSEAGPTLATLETTETPMRDRSARHVHPTQALREIPTERQGAVPPVRLQTLVVLTWLLGFMVMCTRLGVGWYRLRCICRRAASVSASDCFGGMGPCQVRVRLTCDLEGPVCLGVCRPVVLLPRPMYESVDPQGLKMVLTHEMAHIARGDGWVNLFQRLAEAIFFFHPLVWLASRQLTQEREHICDNYVLDSGALAEDYTALLSSLAERVRGRGALPGIALFEGQLLSRVRHVLDPRLNRQTKLPWQMSAAVTLCVGLVFLVSSSVRLVARPILAKGADIAVPPLALQAPGPVPVSDSRRELDRILDAMRRHDTDVLPIAMHVDMDKYTFTDDGLRPDSTYRIEQRLDGRRLDSLMLVYHIKDGRPTHSSQSRDVFTGEYFLSRRQQVFGEWQTHVTASLYSAQKAQQTLAHDHQWGGVLLGHLRGDRRPMATILKEAADVTLREEAMEVDGFVCRVIEGKTTHGNYKLWVDTQRGFRVRRAIVEKGPGDLFLEKPIARQAPKDAWTTQSVHMEVSSVTLQRVGSKFIPTAESLTTTTVATDGTTRRSRIVVKRSAIDLNPDFDRLGAFVMDGIPEGTHLNNSDPAMHGYGYQWKGGKVTPLAPGGAKIVGQIKFVGHENPATVLAARPLMNVRLMYARFEYRSDGEEANGETQSNSVRLHLDDEGRFRIEDVPPGACTLTFTLKEVFMKAFADGKEGTAIKSIASSDLELTIPASDLSGGDHSIDLGVIEMAIKR